MAEGWITADGSFDIINESNDGTDVRYGYVKRAEPGRVYFDLGGRDFLITGRGAVPEDDFSWDDNASLAFIWFNLRGIPENSRIEDATIHLNVASWTTLTIPAGEGVFARLDTLATDAQVFEATVVAEGGADPGRFDFSWDKIVHATSTNWSPSLERRLDRHDFGPRSDSGILGPVLGAPAGTPFRINVTDALQQLVDDGSASRGALFMLYGTRGVGNFSFAAGHDLVRVGGAGGCPQLTVRLSTERGPKPWGGVRVPFVLTFDDNYDAQMAYFTAVESAGERYVAATCEACMRNDSFDSLNTANPGSIEYLAHSRTHSLLGEMTSADLNRELERDWFMDPEVFSDPPDTGSIVHFVWPGGEGTKYGFEALSKMITYGYVSARATHFRPYEICPIGDLSYLSWDEPVNLYSIVAPNFGLIFKEDGVPSDWAFLKEELVDLVDSCYSDHGKAALILYGHNTLDGATAANISLAYAVVDSLSITKAMSYSEVVQARQAPFMDPAQIVQSRGFSRAQELTAARYDSVRWANSDENMLKVWIEPMALPVSYYSGVEEEKEPCCPPGILAVPNPANPGTRFHFEARESGTVQLAIFDLAGRPVRKIFGAGEAGGRVSLFWNGRDEEGRQLPSGVYLVRASLPSEEKRGKVVLLE